MTEAKDAEPHNSNNAANRLLVFSDDWGRHPSSCQHLIGRLLPNAQVTWVNTIGMRPPRFDLLTFHRGMEKIRGWVGQSLGSTGSGDPGEHDHAIPEGLTVIDAKMWPWMSHSWDRRLNRNLLVRQLTSLAKDAVAVTTIPIVSDLVSSLPVRRWVYYCVDDFSVWPGLDGETLGQMEDDLLPKMDCIVSASETLAEGIRSRGYASEVITHGVDLEFWKSGIHPLAPIIQGVEKPIALFWGVVDKRLNVDWLLALAESMNSGRIVLAGPLQNPDERITNHDRIVLPGPVPFESLPGIAAHARVLIMPYADLPVTRAMQPLKFKEYLATLVPVVATALPAVMQWHDCVDLVRKQKDFVEQTIKHLQGGLGDNADRYQRICSRLSAEGWPSKAKQFQQAIFPTSAEISND